MYEVTQYAVIIYVYYLGPNGLELYRQYKDYDEFLSNTYYDWVKENVINRKLERKRIKDSFIYPILYGFCSYNYRVETEFGEVLYRDRILKDLPSPNVHPTWKGRKYIECKCKFRDSSVPWTGRSHKYSNWLRYPKTTAEKREYFKALYDLEEGSFKIRGRRSAINLPSNWDDQPRSVEKSWKDHREHQWK